MNGITKFVLETFISDLRNRGAQTFYLPDLDTKHQIYRSKPPESIYTELPKKFRFKKERFLDTPLSRSENEHADIQKGLRDLQRYSVWVLAKTQ